MPKAGRKGRYAEWLTEDGLITLEGWARSGLTDSQIAKDKIGISLSTFCEWKARFPELADALKKGKAPVDTKVENALFKRAIGYVAQEIKEIRNKDGEVEQTVIKTYEVPPDTTAQIFWLKNRRPDLWRDKHEVTDTTALDKLDEILRETHAAIVE